MLTPDATYAAGSLPRAWVSSQFGSDASGCGLVTNPCKTFQYAHDSVVVVGGTIYVRDPGGYSPLVITNAISIISDGSGPAIIAAPSGDAIAIQASGGAVLIKGLTLDGAGTGNNGINLTAAGSLIVTNSTIKEFMNPSTYYDIVGNGIVIQPTSGTVYFTISDTVLSGNSNAGIAVAPSLANFEKGPASATVFGSLTRVEAVKNRMGVDLEGQFNAGAVSVIANQVNASANANCGFGANTYGAGISNLYLTRSTATGNGYGVCNALGTVYSYGDNAINGNATDVNGPMNTTRHLQ